MASTRTTRPSTGTMSTPKRPSRLRFFVVAAPILLMVLWIFMDANPTLFFFDLGLSLLQLIQHESRFAALKGKTVWVTGASSGIGAELVCHLVAAESNQVIISARRSDKLQSVAENCKKLSPASPTIISVLPYDAALLDTTEATVNTAMELTNNKPIDMLFLNAGRYQLNPALQSPIEETRAIMRVNFEAPVELAQALIHLGSWRARGHGHIVVTASIMAKGAHSLSSSYSASKQALRGYFQTLSTEEFRWLRVDVVCPGAIATNMWNALDEKIIVNEDGKLSTARFVRLMLTGVIGPQILFYETWISKAPGLLWITLSSFAPHLFHVAIHVLAVGRMAIWEKGGGVEEDALYIPDIVRAVYQSALEHYR